MGRRLNGSICTSPKATWSFRDKSRSTLKPLQECRPLNEDTKTGSQGPAPEWGARCSCMRLRGDSPTRGPVYREMREQLQSDARYDFGRCRAVVCRALVVVPKSLEKKAVS
jgi:hypothetical protein